MTNSRALEPWPSRHLVRVLWSNTRTRWRRPTSRVRPKTRFGPIRPESSTSGDWSFFPTRQGSLRGGKTQFILRENRNTSRSSARARVCERVRVCAIERRQTWLRQHMSSGVTLSLTAEPRRLVNLAFPTPRSARFACAGPRYNGLRQSGATRTRDPLHEGGLVPMFSASY